jgi:hypothetical protein
MFPSFDDVFESLDLFFAFIKKLLAQLRHAALVKSQAFFAPGSQHARACNAKSEQLLANYGERCADQVACSCTERKKL